MYFYVISKNQTRVKEHTTETDQRHCAAAVPRNVYNIHHTKADIVERLGEVCWPSPPCPCLVVISEYGRHELSSSEKPRIQLSHSAPAQQQWRAVYYTHSFLSARPDRPGCRRVF